MGAGVPPLPTGLALALWTTAAAPESEDGSGLLLDASADVGDEAADVVVADGLLDAFVVVRVRDVLTPPTNTFL